MNENYVRQMAFGITLLLIVALGIWQIKNGNLGYGVSLICATLAALVARYIKERRISELQAKGINPYDERAYFIAGMASQATLINCVLFAVLFVLIGSAFGPQVSVNPYDFLGYCIAIVVGLYAITYFYYNKKN